MFLLPPPAVTQSTPMVLGSLDSPPITAGEFIKIAEAARHGVMPMMHGMAGMARTAFDWQRAALECVGVSRAFTTPLGELSGVCAVAALICNPRIQKPDWGLGDHVKITEVQSEAFKYGAFGGMLHFQATDPKTGVPVKTQGDPLLLIAPNSGHPPEYIDETVKAYMEAGRDVYVAYCKDGMDIPVSAGKFGLNDYISMLAAFVNHFKGDVHVAPICQPGPPLLAALALMGKLKKDGHGHIHGVNSLIAKANPLDTSVNPQPVNDFANRHSIEWFERNTKAVVPEGYGYAGEGRAIYYGPWQIVCFMAGKPDAHLRAFADLQHAVAHDHHAAEHKLGGFYDLRFLVPSSPTWDWYKETVDEWFLKNSLAKGTFRFTGEICGVHLKDEPVDLTHVQAKAAISVEGEKDDITGLGQTSSVIKRLSGVAKKYYLVVRGAGHTGVFRGTNFKEHVLMHVVDALKAFDSKPTAPPPRLPTTPLRLAVSNPALAA